MRECFSVLRNIQISLYMHYVCHVMVHISVLSRVMGSSNTSVTLNEHLTSWRYSPLPHPVIGWSVMQWWYHVKLTTIATNNWELWCFLYHTPGQAVEQAVELSVMWDTKSPWVISVIWSSPNIQWWKLKSFENRILVLISSDTRK